MVPISFGVYGVTAYCQGFRRIGKWGGICAAFYSIYPDSQWTFYGMVELWPIWGEDFSYFFQSGFGIKYQLTRGLLEIESLVTHFLAGQNEGAGSTFNLGLRLIK